MEGVQNSQNCKNNNNNNSNNNIIVLSDVIRHIENNMDEINNYLNSYYDRKEETKNIWNPGPEEVRLLSQPKIGYCEITGEPYQISYDSDDEFYD
jgi:hypothetical protein